MPHPHRAALTGALLVAGCTGGVVAPPDTTRPADVREGDLVIAELMIDPTACDDGDGQWIELLNRRDVALELTGLRLSNGADVAPITSGAALEPGAVAVGAPVGAEPCHDFEPDFRYEPLVLGLGDGARVDLLSTSGRVDLVAYGDWPVAPGEALALDPDAQTASANDVQASWCSAWRPIGETFDRGSPGRPNPTCDPGDTGVDPTPTALTLADLDPGDLVITEVMVTPASCANDTAQYVEVLNASGRAVDLSGLVIDDGAGSAPVVPAPTVPPGAWLLFAIGQPAASCWVSGVVADGYYDRGLLLSQSETVRIGHGDPLVVLDAVDLSALTSSSGASLQLSADALDATSNDDPASWCASTRRALPTDPAITDRGSPGGANDLCELAPQVRLGSDLLPGDLVLTEVMPAPEGCRDDEAEYFEVFNASGVPLDLMGLQIVIDGLTTRLQRSYPVAAGAWALAEYYDGATPATCYTNLQHDFLWDSGLMPDGGAVIELRSDNGLIDRVDFRGWPRTPGRSLNLSASAVDPTLNDDPASWCHTVQSFPNSQGDRGTPRQPNETCAAGLDTGAGPTGDTATGPTGDTAPDDTGLVLDLTVADLRPGDLVITEALSDPVNCVDHEAEYFELYNRTRHRVNLQNLEIVVNGVTTTLTRVYTLQPRQWAIAEFSSGSPATCLPGVQHDLLWAGGLGALMPDGGGVIELKSGSVVFDRVNLIGLSTMSGRAVQLDAQSIDATLNDDASRWCLAQDTFLGSLGNYGSPGQPNHPCGAAGDSGDTGGVVIGPVDELTVPELQPGDLIITEFMTLPTDCAAYQAEYVEIYNNTDQVFDPTGLLVGIGGGTAPVSNVRDLPPRSYGVLRYTTGSAPTCYAFDHTAWYSTGTMGTSPRITVQSSTQIIDLVFANGWPSVVAGAAAELDPSRLDATLNDDPSSWCVASTPIPGGAIDRGSPTLENSRCLAPPPAAGDTAGLPDTGTP